MPKAWIALVVLGTVLSAASAPTAHAEDAPEPVRLMAEGTDSDSYIGRSRRSRTIRVVIEPDGAVRLLAIPGKGEAPWQLAEFRLSSERMLALRRAVDESRFFQTWTQTSAEFDRASWAVAVEVGGRSRRRSEAQDAKEFEPLWRYLHPFVRQARWMADLKRGDLDRVRFELGLDRGALDRFADWETFLAEVVARAAAREDLYGLTGIALVLLSAPSPEEWARGATDLLALLRGERRGAVLYVWACVLRAPERADHREAFMPLALAELEASWPRWGRMSPAEDEGFEWLLRLAFREDPWRALGVAEAVMRDAKGSPRTPPGLLEWGEETVPFLARLLDEGNLPARAAAAHVAKEVAWVLRGTSLPDGWNEEGRAAVARRFGSDLAPALERRAEDAAETPDTRQTAWEALDLFDGRVAAARGRPTPGALTITGRVVARGDTPLSGVVVLAVGPTGVAGRGATGADGAFRIEGLEAGDHSLFVHSTDALRDHLGEPVAERVPAGSEETVVRLRGSLLRGRLLDEAGAPAKQRRVALRMRNARSGAPSYPPRFVTTDDEGRWILIRSMLGTYDAEVAGHEALLEATGLETGPEEWTIRLAAGSEVAGRVVDETGAPLEGIPVSVLRDDRDGTSIAAATTDAEGRFTVPHLDATRRYRISATLPAAIGRSATVPARHGAKNHELRVDGAPRLHFRVDFGERADEGSSIRVERIGGTVPVTRDFRVGPVLWHAAPAGAWRVSTRVEGVDARGVPTATWVEVGTVTTGEPETTLVVPR